MSLARNATASQSPNQTNGYERHQPDQTLLYQLVEQHYPAFKASLEAQGQHLPRYIQQEFNDLLQCGRLEYGFMRVRCEDCHHERLVAFSCKRRGFCPSCGCPPDGRECGAADRRSLPQGAHSPVGAQLSFPATLFAGSPSPADGPGLEYRLSYTLNSSDQKSRLHQSLCTNWLSDSYPTLWLRAKSQCPLPHAVSRWCLCRR